MKTTLHLVLTGLLLSTGLLADTRDARACSAPAPPEGYFVAVTSQAVAVDDPSTSLVCTLAPGRCGGSTRFKGITKNLVATATVNATAGIAGAVKVERLDEVAWILKDAAGVEIERQSGSSARFAKLGASVCVRVMWEQADTGVPSDRVSELCAPVTVTSLAVTKQDLSDHEASILRDCLRLDEGLVDPPDAGTTTQEDGGKSGAGATTGGGGCSVANANSASYVHALLLLGLTALASKRRRAQRRQ
jgi:hypothetical protein